MLGKFFSCVLNLQISVNCIKNAHASGSSGNVCLMWMLYRQLRHSLESVDPAPQSGYVRYHSYPGP